MATTLARRVGDLETRCGIDDDGGCPKCNETLIVIRDAITSELHSARDASGAELSAEELRERERRCLRCGRERDSDKELVIQLGGFKPKGANR
jgi:hypothetical protein